MKRAIPDQTERARQLLAREGAGPSATAGEWATAAGRVYDQLHAHLDPLLGAAGVQALLVRSTQLTESEFSFLEGAILERSTTLHDCLRAQEAAVAADAAAALFGNFFALISTFIGERLTTQVLRRAWPMIEETGPRETE